ncbi:NAD(P)/FAD-dependent oxidoreductase [Neobacillus sp. D3-1R]|uniref:NAD(P)/FAD-dependent oxidoreductase n=1 Tax=Neobacillus sp. D3-1R TaxID=3445778 RepID=UPI003FA1032F
MNTQKTIVILGGGYAGINLIKQLKNEFSGRLNNEIKIILIDKNSFHFKKVKLFKAIVEDNISSLHVPLESYCGSEIEFIQGELTTIQQLDQEITVKLKSDESITIHYDYLVLALGSIVSEVYPNRGGISLCSIQNAQKTREDLLQLISGKEKLRVAIVGGGITGIETSAELLHWLKKEAYNKGISPENIEIMLFNKNQRLLNDLPFKVSQRLQNRLKGLGVSIHHYAEVKEFQQDKVYLADGGMMEADYCIWTVGLKPNPCLKTMGLSLNRDGKIETDSSYHFSHNKNIYAIGDCAFIVDPKTGVAAGMTCKEAIAQAQKLAKIIKDDLKGIQASKHKSMPNLYCIGLGPNDGFVWTQRWGINFTITGKIGAEIREYTWDLASLFFK